VLERYTWEQTAAGYLQVLKGMLPARLPIPAYFTDPRTENEPSFGSLASIWPSAKST